MGCISGGRHVSVFPRRDVHALNVFLQMQTFIIDKSGKCVLSFNNQFGAEKHVGEALKVIEQIA